MIFRSCILLPYSSSFFSFGPGIHGRCLPRVCIPPSSSSFFQLYLITGSPLLLLFYFSLWSSCGGRVYWNRLCSFRMGAGDWSAVHFSLEWVLETGEGLIFSYGVGWKLAGSVFFFFFLPWMWVLVTAQKWSSFASWEWIHFSITSGWERVLLLVTEIESKAPLVLLSLLFSSDLRLTTP